MMCINKKQNGISSFSEDGVIGTRFILFLETTQITREKI